jgi:hypothetical protein
MHTENQLPRLPGSGVGWVDGVGSYPLLSQAPTHVEVELGCDNLNSVSLLWLLFSFFLKNTLIIIFSVY